MIIAPNKPLPQQAIDTIKRLYDEGYNDPEIAAVLQCPRHRVSRARRLVLGLRGHYTRCAGKVAVQRLCERLSRAGYPDWEVGKKAGVSVSTVNRLRRRAGIPPNNYGEIAKARRSKGIKRSIRNEGAPYGLSCRIKAAKLGWPGEPLRAAMLLAILENGEFTSKEIFHAYSELTPLVTGKTIRYACDLRHSISLLCKRGMIDKRGLRPKYYRLSGKAKEMVKDRTKRGFVPKCQSTLSQIFSREKKI